MNIGDLGRNFLCNVLFWEQNHCTWLCGFRLRPSVRSQGFQKVSHSWEISFRLGISLLRHLLSGISGEHNYH